MGLTASVIQLAKHAWFCRDGDAFTTPSAGTVSRTAIPAVTPALDAAWIEIGLIEGFEHDYSGGQDLEVWRPSPGHLELYELREIKPKLTYKFTSGELSPLALEVFYRTSQKMTSATNQFNPGAGTLRTGWLHVQCYDSQTDDLRLTIDLYGRIKITGGIKSEEGSIVKPAWEFAKLYSTLNTAGV
jgi:hypothetical protein